MNKTLFIAMALIAGTTTAAFAEHRELGPHQHGHGTLNIAVDGNKVSLEFEAPGADIAGFEHEPSTDAEKATLQNSTATLMRPLELFQFPQAAGCSVKDAKVKFEEEDEHEHEKHEAEAGKKADAADAKKDDDKDGDHDHEHEAHHAAFHGEYTLECKSPGDLTALSFPYFATFKNAQSLTVAVITSKGQSQFEVSKAKPAIDLSSLK